MEEKNLTYAAIGRYIRYLVIGWTIVFMLSIGMTASETQHNAEHQAFIRSRAIVERDMLYRQWAAGFGGVYVPVSGDVHPSPFLSAVHNRDI